MAIICRSHRLLFLQAPRTGCTAIERLLKDRFGGEMIPPERILGDDGFVRVGRKHCTIRQLLSEQLIPADYSHQLTAATAIRNPFDSLVSLYLKKREKYQPLLADPNAWIHRVRGYVEDMEFCRTHTFDEWLVRRLNTSVLDRLRDKGRKALYGPYADGVSVVLRFERLQQDFDALMRGLGIEGDLTIPVVNLTRQRSAGYQSYYTPRGRKLVEYAYQHELERFGYYFGGFDETRKDPPSHRLAG